MILEQLYPRRVEMSAYLIPYEHYYAKGIRGVIFDIDNTLAVHNGPADREAMQLFRRLHSLGLHTCLLSNNKEPRVRSFAEQVESSYVFQAGKPKTAGYEKAMKQMGTERSSTLFVGDQLFTDILGANRAGIYSILVKPINPKEEIQIVLKRYLEKPVLYCYKRRCRQKGAGK